MTLPSPCATFILEPLISIQLHVKERNYPFSIETPQNILSRRPLDFLLFAGQKARRRKEFSPYQGFFLCAVGIRNDGTIVSSFNGCGNHPIAFGHAEARLCRKLDYGATVYVARFNFGTESLALAKPCQNCQRMLIRKKVKRVYYSDGPNSFSILDFSSLS